MSGKKTTEGKIDSGSVSTRKGDCRCGGKHKKVGKKSIKTIFLIKRNTLMTRRKSKVLSFPLIGENS